MLKSITLNNWRSHGTSTLRFAKGTNIIIGRMGGGKSSVIDAICFALFGTCPAVQSRRLKTTDFIRNRPDEQPQAEVTLVFDHKGSEYTITRKIKRKGVPEAEIRKDGKRMEGPQSERVSDYIHHLIEIDYDLFTRAIYSEQNRIDYFLQLRSGERKRQIDELIGIDKFETVRKNATTAASRLKTMKADKESFMRTADPSKVRREIDEHNLKLSELKREKTGIESDLSAADRRKKELETGISAMSKERDSYRRLSDDKAGLQHTLGMLKRDVESSPVLGDMSGMKAKLDAASSSKLSLQKELDALDSSYRSLSSSAGKLQAEEQEAKRKLQKKEELAAKGKSLLGSRKAEEIQKELAELDRKGAEALASLAKGTAELAQLESAVKELMKGTAKCPVCDSELTEQKRNDLLKAKTSAIDRAHADAEEADSTIKRSKKAIQSLKDLADNARRVQDLLEQYSGVEEQLRESGLKSASAKKEIDGLRLKRDELSKKVNSAANEYLELAKTFERIIEMDNKKRRMSEISAKLHSIEADLAKVRFDDKAWDEMNRRLKDATVALAEVNGRKDRVAEGEKYIAELVKEKTARLQETERYADEVKRYSAAIEELQLFSNAVVETQFALREELIDAVNQALSEVWTAVYPYSDYSVIKLQPSESDYELAFKINDEFVSVDGVASGGERALACLALRVAFAMVLTPNLSWLILDEPTHNLDEEAVKTLAETLRDHIPRIVDQTFVITHEENMKEAASGRMFRIRRKESQPEVSEVEELHEASSITPSLS
ncbi:DNA double-strand break repair Rad50 ATPase [uncultured archaeon]|nr:DNA double-strand break repair Rad50 ATPase [uncultured archaeon]